MDGKVIRTPATTNMILGQLKASWRVWSRFLLNGPVEDAMGEKGMIPGGWNRQRETSNTQHHPRPVEDIIEEKEMIPGAWNRQRGASNNQ